jgi:hypothetical protein
MLVGLVAHSAFAFLLGVISTAIGVGRHSVKRRADQQRRAEEAELRAYQLRIAWGQTHYVTDGTEHYAVDPATVPGLAEPDWRHRPPIPPAN